MEIILKKELDIPVVNPNIPNTILDGGDVLFTGKLFIIIRKLKAYILNLQE